MANYYGYGRTNYFAVKDEQAFREDIGKTFVELLERKTEEDGQTLFGFLQDDLDTWYAIEADDETGEPEVTWAEFFQKHLADGWVAIIMEVGHEKYRFLNGTATAYNNKGEERFIDIGKIVELGLELGEFVTSPTY